MLSPESIDLVDVLDADTEDTPESPLLRLSEAVGIASASVLSTLFDRTLVPGTVFGCLTLSTGELWFFDDGNGSLFGAENGDQSPILGYVGYGNGSLVFMVGIVERLVVYALKGERSDRGATQGWTDTQVSTDGCCAIITLTSDSGGEPFEVEATNAPFSVDADVHIDINVQLEGVAVEMEPTTTRVRLVIEAGQHLLPERCPD